jgi:hypothetical protein
MGPLSDLPGYFKFGDDVICYGQFAGLKPPPAINRSLPEALDLTRTSGGQVQIPFDLSQVVDNLRQERYQQSDPAHLRRFRTAATSRNIYYSLRPVLPVFVRKYLQRIHLKGWDSIPFPSWPVDLSVERLMKQVMKQILKSGRVERMPFVWFWPEGAPGCMIMTHDVETSRGLRFCEDLMKIDDSFGIKSAFQVVPEVRYDADRQFLKEIKNQGFEVNVHDLNHDGALFLEKKEFLRRAELINGYVKEFQAEGFRAGAMYRNQNWFEAFQFSYDMSVPNVAHLEPQRGGCCTVMPYFVGKILELPLTTIQDYALMHILGDYSIELWKQQTDLILKNNGLVSFIIHPDYVIDRRAQTVYKELLQHMVKSREERKLIILLPSEVNRWWRTRAQLNLIQEGKTWEIKGEGSERARVAYASLDGDKVVYKLEPLY